VRSVLKRQYVDAYVSGEDWYYGCVVLTNPKRCGAALSRYQDIIDLVDEKIAAGEKPEITLTSLLERTGNADKVFDDIIYDTRPERQFYYLSTVPVLATMPCALQCDICRRSMAERLLGHPPTQILLKNLLDIRKTGCPCAQEDRLHGRVVAAPAPCPDRVWRATVSMGACGDTGHQGNNEHLTEGQD